MTELILPLLLFALVAVGSPGANNILAADSGARYGLRRSAPLLGGTLVSLVSVVALAGLGLGSVVTAVPALRTGLLAAGTAYLLWLAYRISGGSRPDPAGEGPDPEGEASADGRGRGGAPGFRTGLLVTWLNPKAWIMGLSAAAGYARLSPDPLVLAAVLGTAFAVVLVPNLLLWCAGGRLLASRLRTERQWRVLNGVLAALLVVSVIPMWLE